VTRRECRAQAAPPLTPIARAVYLAAFNGEPLPRGWRVEWAGFMRGALGLCINSERRILLSLGDLRTKRTRPTFYRSSAPGCVVVHGVSGYYDRPKCILEILVHEFVHSRTPGLRHGKEFDSLVRAAVARVWEAAQ
jgi:hypothetical protein